MSDVVQEAKTRWATYVFTRMLVLADPAAPHNKSALDKVVSRTDSATLVRVAEAARTVVNVCTTAVAMRQDEEKRQ